MMFSNKKLTTSVCPKTGKTIEQKSNFRWLRWLYPITGLLALLWFLIRVIPKPSRATYPCQRVAFPLASGLIIWIMGLLGSVAAYRKAQKYIAKARYAMAVICIVISIGFIWIASNSTDENPAYAHEPIIPNSPLGQAKGIYPGRVAWIHDPDAASWSGSDGDTSSPYWHEDVCTDQTVVNEMLSKALRALTGRSNDAEAWDVIFKNFNQQMGRGYVGYTPGEKIAIKVNFVLMYSNPYNGEKPSFLLDQIDNSPQLAIALLKQLINTAGVSPDDISIGDPLMMMPNHWYNMVYAECPGVVYLSKSGYPLTGRTQVSLDYDAPFYWSDPITSRVEGKTQDYIPTHFAQSDYFINFPVLKSHNDGGITLSGKNHFGSLMRVPNASGYYDMHYTRATETPGMGHYRAIVDLLGHPKLGGKTMLTLIDGLYSGRSWDSHPIRWDMAPFNGHWPSSIFLSQDPVAADSVAFDFMDNEWDASPSDINGYPQKSGADDYLHEAALIPNPPSGANYNPNQDGGLTKSLGVHEHWNNASDKQYSRNLDPVNGTGIELVTEPSVVGDVYRDGVVDFKDFTVFAAAWGSQPGHNNWNVACDISMPSDGIIDELDLAVICDDWLNVFVTCLVQPGATLQEVYSASGIFFEGPTWDPASNKLFFTRRTGIYQILRLDSPGSVTVWMNNSPQTNGTFLSLDGRLLTADEYPRQISSHRIDPGGPGDSQILADSSDGFSKKPNDLCQLANGNIYFTTPDWGADPGSQGVYLLEPDGTVTLVKNGLYQPNGVIASLDGTKLYVAESSNSFNPSREQWWVFNIKTDGTLDAGSVFFKPTSPPNPSNVPDGMTIDELGNLYFSGLGGIWIVSPQGELLEFISIPQSVSNVTFGGPNGRTLYMTCQDKVYSLDMCVRGGRPYMIPIPSHSATNPNPPNGAATVNITAELSWTADPDATSHDVYFGTSNPPPFIHNQAATTFDPGTMEYSTTYYWRIDELGAYGTIPGQVWNFTTIMSPPPPP
jgi:sugar lactone lactonase YvrE